MQPLPRRLPLYAALDLGTNNCRLLVAGKKKGGLKVVDSFSRVVRLGEGLAAAGAFSPEAQERAVEALKICKEKLMRHKIDGIRAVATEACRKASNSKEFLARVKKETGIQFEIIDHEEEARLAFKGCMSLLQPGYSHALAFDIGGGSTELLWCTSGDRPQILHWSSIACGVMSLSEQYGKGEYTKKIFDQVVEAVRKQMAPFDKNLGIREAIKEGTAQTLCTSGTVTTVAAIHLGLARYDRRQVDGYTIDRQEILSATQKILDMSLSQRFSNPCIGPERADYILSGCAILEAICRIWDVPRITIADRGVREGIILSFFEKNRDQAKIKKEA